MRTAGSWVLLLILALLLIVIGMQGSLGRVIAVVFVPADLEIGDSEA